MPNSDTPALAPATILIVDDEESIRMLCERVLSKIGCRILSAKNGEEALRLLSETPCEIVITDMTMPGMTGGELLGEIKNRLPSTDVIIMTGFPALETAIPTLRRGAYDYLIKPFDSEFLTAVVKRCLEKRALSDELNREKALHRELQAAYAQLQELEYLKEAFLARINHELRIPLAPAFLAVDLLSKNIKEPGDQSLLSMLRSRLDQMQGIVENLLLFVDLRKQEFNWVKTDIHLPDLIRGIHERLSPEFDDRKVTFAVTVKPGSEMAWGDVELVETLLRNLLLNAVRFSRLGGKVAVGAAVKNGQTEISVKDEGIGIPTEKLDRIFDSFYQVANYLTREVGGLGIGLTLARRIAELHGGTVIVRSRLGEGSTFIVLLPSPPSQAVKTSDCQVPAGF
jgi:signal transduction histidine kinase